MLLPGARRDCQAPCERGPFPGTSVFWSTRLRNFKFKLQVSSFRTGQRPMLTGHRPETMLITRRR
jgi:hypothetical protein